MSGEIKKVPAFRVKVIDASDAGEKELHTQDFKQPPGSDFLDVVVGPQEWDRVRARRNTHSGGMKITFRNQSAGNTNPQFFFAQPEEPAKIPAHGGKLYRIVVEQLPESEWMAGQAVKFSAPKASITAEPGGWRVTFEPQQYPCVLTVAVATKGAKDENLPSFPFPSNPKHASGSFLIPKGQFGAEEGGLIRLGVRGAGLTTQLKLPKEGKTVNVKPTAFKLAGTAQPDFLTDAYVATKFNEKKALIQYG